VPQALELVRFTVKPDNVDAMLAARPSLVAALRSFPGFVDIHLGRIDDATWIDVVLWESREQAEAAAATAGDNRDLARTFALIDQVVNFEHADVVDTAAPAASAR
jgi:hypothetical protein